MAVIVLDRVTLSPVADHCVVSERPLALVSTTVFDFTAPCAPNSRTVTVLPPLAFRTVAVSTARSATPSPFASVSDFVTRPLALVVAVDRD
ncbi:hypothetical protein [Sinorhizobium medicae]|uniref:hypothetical protein n=1 Tax=Sinorhizobium medicae TaxID=110321 RepID=UPI0013902A33|nr:hypothetical protein [Sinorhizobium medicae]